MRRGILASISLIILVGCQGGNSLPWNPLTLSPEAEALAGRRAAPALERQFDGIWTDSTASERMFRIGNRLSRGIPEVTCEWDYRLLASDKVNAFSLPGGFVYMTRGLYGRIGSDDNMLAAVIAHEMAHIVHKDGLKQNCGSTKEALAREMSADSSGMDYLAATGYPPGGMIKLLQLIRDIQPHGWAEIRINNALQWLASSDNSSRTLVQR